MEFVEQLTNLGLNEKEAKVYLALLSINRATAYSVALKSGLKKPTTYVVLEDLVKKGFVLKTPMEKKSLYIAKSPQECISIVQNRINEAKEILPELLAIQKKDEGKTLVSYYEGIEGIKEVYNDTLKYSGKEFLAFGSEDVVKSLGYDWMNQFIKNRVKKNIFVRSILPTTQYFTDELLKKDPEELRSMKFVSQEESPFSIEIDIYGDSKVSLISGKEAMGTIIESKEVYDTMKLIFELLWKKLPESKKE
jgi:sugar-specific transcriptional regulator TrmB